MFIFALQIKPHFNFIFEELVPETTLLGYPEAIYFAFLNIIWYFLVSLFILFLAYNLNPQNSSVYAKYLQFPSIPTFGLAMWGISIMTNEKF